MNQCGCGKNFSCCDCCAGVEALTPQPTANRPGLSRLNYRVGTHRTFFETMQARLSNFRFEDSGKTAEYPLRGLRTRRADDASIAVLSAAATVFDVLTFYQERIANEGFLRTATERRSVLELGRLVGYVPRPGVAASVFLAYAMEDKSEPVEIPAGARAQSIPLPNELPQSFETSEKIEARKEWNDLKPRQTRPQNISARNAARIKTIYFAGTETNLKPNDPLLFVFEGERAAPVLRKIENVEPLFEDKKTKITLQLDSKNIFIELLERCSNNFGAFCVGSQNALGVRASALLAEFRKAADDDDDDKSEPPDFKRILQEAAVLIIDIDAGAHAGMQKWFADFTSEFIHALRASGAIDEWLNGLSALGSFEEFLPELQKFADVLGNFGELIKVLRRQNSFDDLFGETISVVRRLKNFEEEKLLSFIGADFGADVSASAFGNLVSLTRPLSLPASKQPSNSSALPRDTAATFDLRQDTLPQLLTAFNPQIGANVYEAWANTIVTRPLPVKIYTLRMSAPLFGNSVPPRVFVDPKGQIIDLGDYPVVEVRNSTQPPPGAGNDGAKTVIKHEDENAVYLDSSYDKIKPDGWIVIDMRRVEDGALENFTLPPNKILAVKTKDVSTAVWRNEYGMTGKTTRLDLGETRWIDFWDDEEKLQTSKSAEFQIVRRTVVHAQSEPLELTEEPVNDDVCGGEIELGALYEGLRPGRWAIVSGERTDVPNTTGIRASELVMLAGVKQTYSPQLRGDKIHSTLILAKPLAYTYRRDTVKIYGNVVKATHGETRSEVLGSGSAAETLPTFTLKQPPLTFVSAPNEKGIESTLEVRVNDVRWHEIDTLAGLKPNDRRYIIKIDDEAKTSVVFGDGEQGARLPTGIENVKAIYRSGIGTAGNVKAEQISLPVTKPLGVKEVINPLRASGGADRETRDQARRNVPTALFALDRLVSTKDYADFTRTFAGIGKASAKRLSDGRRQVVHLTITGADDAPIDVNSDLYHSLRRAFAKYGDAFQPVQIATRELLALVVAARVKIHADYLWENVAPKIQTRLFGQFGFERRELGQSVFLGEIIHAIQAVEGVVYADVDVLDGIAETELSDEKRLQRKFDSWIKTNAPKAFVRASLARVNENFRPNVDSPSARILPAQLACLMSGVPHTLILNQIEEAKK